MYKVDRIRWVRILRRERHLLRWEFHRVLFWGLLCLQYTFIIWNFSYTVVPCADGTNILIRSKSINKAQHIVSKVYNKVKK